MKMILMQIKLIFTTKVSHLASSWEWDFLELRNGLLSQVNFLKDFWDRYWKRARAGQQEIGSWFAQISSIYMKRPKTVAAKD